MYMHGKLPGEFPAYVLFAVRARNDDKYYQSSITGRKRMFVTSQIEMGKLKNFTE